jgi:hypothetical protein
LRNKYDLTPGQFDDILAAQGGVCGVCGRESDQFVVDHDHDTGQIRGVLCHKCNLGLGQFNDDHELLLKAASYLASQGGATCDSPSITPVASE